MKRCIPVVFAAVFLAGCGSDELPSNPNPNANPTTVQTQGQSATPAPTEGGGEEAGATTSAKEKVNEEDYRGKAPGTTESFYFRNADGSYACTITESFTGCNASALPDDVPDVEGAYGRARANSVAFSYGEKGKWVAASDPAYTYIVPGEDPPGGKELPVGSKLTGHGTTCEVLENTGVSCHKEGHGFTVSPESAEFS